MDLLLLEVFSDYSEQLVMKVLNKLDDIERKIILMRYPLEPGKRWTLIEIAKECNVPKGSIWGRINIIEKKMIKMLESTIVDDVDEVFVVEEKPIISVPEEPIISVPEEPVVTKEVITVLERINEIKELIKADALTEEDYYSNIDGIMIDVSVSEAECFLAYKDKKRSNELNRVKGMKRICYVYIIKTFDYSNQLSEEIIIKDNNKFYKYVNRYSNGEYDLSNVRDNELVCYDIKGISISFVKSSEIKPVTKVEVVKPVEEVKKETIGEQSESFLRSKFEAGIVYFNKKQYKEAKAEFLKTLNSKDRFVLQKANYYLGRIYMVFKEYKLAEEHYATSIEIYGKYYYSLLEMGKALSFQRRYDEAINWFYKCNVLYPDSNKHIIEMGKSYALKGNNEEALKIFETVITKDPNDYFAHFEKGKLLYNLGHFDKAIIEFELCAALNPDSVRHEILIGQAKYLSGEIIEALNIFDTCVENELRIGSIALIHKIGYFFHSRGEKELAYKYYLKSPQFSKTARLTDKEIEKHIEPHTIPNYEKANHSVFNPAVSLDILKALNNIVNNIEKTITGEKYDIYQVHCENIGYKCTTDGPNIQEDYLLILTLPFTKRIVNAYPALNFFGEKVKWSIKLDDLINFNGLNDIPLYPIKDGKIECVDTPSNIVTMSDVLPQNDLKESIIKSNCSIDDKVIMLLVLTEIHGKKASFQEAAQMYGLEEKDIYNIVKSGLEKLSNDRNQALNNLQQELTSLEQAKALLV